MPQKEQSQQQPRPSCSVSEQDSETTGATIGSAAVLPEYVNVGIQLARGTAVRSIIATAGAEAAEGVIAVLGGPVTLGALAIGVGVYAYDRYSGGKVTRFLNRQLAHLELRIGEGCQ